MTGFFATIAARAVGEPSPLRPRYAQRFEHQEATAPLPAGGLTVVEHSAVSPPASPPPGHTDPTQSRPRVSTGDDHRGKPSHAPDRAPQAAPTEAPAASRATTAGDVEEAGPISRADIDRAVQVARDAAEAARATHDGQEHVRPAAGSPSRPQPVPEPHADERDSPSAPTPGTTPQNEAVAASAHEGRAADAAELEAPTKDEPLGSRPVGPVHPRAPAHARPSRPPTRRAQPVDVAALLREQVFSALAESGSIPTGVTPVVATSTTSPTPTPGTATVRAEGVRIEPPVVETPASGDVHVHIARVSVTQAPPGSPPAPRVSRSETVRRSVDHQDYLARRRERG